MSGEALMGALDRLYSFMVIRGFKVWISYKTQVVLNFISWSIPIFLYYFIGLTFGIARMSALVDYNYTAFAAIGIAFQGYFSAAVTTLAGRIRNEQLMGTLEYQLAAPLSPMSLMMYSTVWGFVINAISTVTVLLISMGLGVAYHVNVLATSVALLLYMASIIGLNLIAGAVILIVKQGNPVALFTSIASNILGNVVFPISILPQWLKDISYALSITWALSALRDSMLMGYGLARIIPLLWPLAILSAAYLAIGVATVNYAFRKVLVEGTVHMY